MQELHRLFLRAAGDVVQPSGWASRAVGLDGLVVAEGLEVSHRLLGELECGLATRPDDTAPRVGGDGVAKLLDGHLGARVKLRVAEAAAEIASAQADEDRGLAHVHTFALQAVKYFVDQHECRGDNLGAKIRRLA